MSGFEQSEPASRFDSRQHQHRYLAYEQLMHGACCQFCSAGLEKTDRFFLLATIILGIIFLGIKFVEYSREFSQHLFPGADFQYQGTNPAQAKIFFSLYFTLTGLHAVHMIIGLFLIVILAFMAWRRNFTPEHYAPVDMIGLYWHFVDIVWIFIFPLLYLIGPK